MIYIIDPNIGSQRKNANRFMMRRGEIFVDPNTKPRNKNLHSPDLLESNEYPEPS